MKNKIKRNANKIFLLLLTAIPAAISGQQNGGSVLKNISVFHEYGAYREKGVDASIYCSAWGGIETENGVIPLDRTVTNGKKKVYRFKAGGGGGIMFPLHGWGAFSLEQYYENGFIEFDIRGASGGENLNIGLRSDTRNIVRTRSISLSSQNVQVTTSWQHIKIPIKNIAGNMGEGFSIQNITLVIIEVPQRLQFYLSEMYITSADREKQYPVIKVNQAGYELNQNKYALVSCFPGTYSLSANTEFYVVNEGGERKFSGKLRQVTKNADASSGEIVYRADFTALNEPGTYRISITNPRIDDSFKFNISRNVYNGVLADTLKYFYFQRQGIDLEQKYAGVFARKNLHPGDRTVKKYSQRSETNAPVFDVSCGWYDAGDFGKYFPPAASTVTDLLFAYELFPQLFPDNHFNIPESTNGVPDILDEIKWELDMMLKMEDGSTGGFYEVANYEGDTIYLIDTNGVNGAGNTKSTIATAWAAGVFAHAYIVYKNIPAYKTFADQCIAAARRAWTYLEARPKEHSWVSGAGRSYYYDSAETAKIKFLAAAALYRAAGEDKFQKYVIDNYRGFNYSREFNANHVVTIGDIGTGFLHYAMSPNPNSAVIKFFRGKFEGFEKEILKTYNDKAWPNALVDWAYFWGSSKPVVRIPVELYMCNKVLNKDMAKSIQVLRDAVNYILGINPLSFSFISGFGENSVKSIYSGIFTSDNIYEVPRGYLAGGANQYEAGFMSNYPAKCYVDSDREWTTNEHAIYWNAAMVLCLTVAVGTIDK
jgi:hypothetical protein